MVFNRFPGKGEQNPKLKNLIQSLHFLTHPVNEPLEF